MFSKCGDCCTSGCTPKATCVRVRVCTFFTLILERESKVRFVHNCLGWFRCQSESYIETCLMAIFSKLQKSCFWWFCLSMNDYFLYGWYPIRLGVRSTISPVINGMQTKILNLIVETQNVDKSSTLWIF